MDEKIKKKLIKNNKEISRLLRENETLFYEAGFRRPVKNFSLEKEEKINFPSGYIRTTGEFGRIFNLNEIVQSQHTKKNIAYALQLSDYYNFHLNRFYIWGSIKTMLYKHALLNVVSVIEALILECANNINANCQKCKKNGRCRNNICRSDRENMKNAAKKLNDLRILELSAKEFADLMVLYDYRNRIHIRISEQNEFIDNKFNQELYNKAIKFLRIIDDQLLQNGVPLYSTCKGFLSK